MSRLSTDQIRRIEARLEEAGAVLPCPSCGSAQRTVLDGYLIGYVQSQGRNMVISGDNSILCTATVCTQCGYLAQHVLDVLEEATA